MKYAPLYSGYPFYHLPLWHQGLDVEARLVMLLQFALGVAVAYGSGALADAGLVTREDNITLAAPVVAPPSQHWYVPAFLPVV